MSTITQRLLFCTTFLDLEAKGKVTQSDFARMAGLLIRWVEDTVESPPRRPGATPEERADDYVHMCCMLVHTLCQNILPAYIRRSKLSDEPRPRCPLFSSLPRPAQSAWRRLLTQHLAHLPSAARIDLALARWLDGDDQHEDDLAQEALALVRHMFESGDFTVEAGRRKRFGFGHLIRTLVVACADGCRSIFEEADFCKARRLCLLFYKQLLRHYDPARRRLVLLDKVGPFWKNIDTPCGVSKTIRAAALS
jgi:hypothetical protein